MHIEFAADAEQDLDDIAAYLTERNPAAARRTLTAILSTIDHLATFPLLGEPDVVEGFRRLVVPRLPYVAIYRLPDQYHVRVERVLHTSREWPLRR